MANSSATYDVFIAYDYRDLESAKSVADNLRSHGLSVFYDKQQIAAGSNIEDALWQAMAESLAFVVILPESIGASWLAFELGAAKAWNKPIYAVSFGSFYKSLPASLRDVNLLPATRIDEIAHSISSTSEPLTYNDVENLGAAYHAAGVTVDQLLMQPQKVEVLVKQFNSLSGRKMAGEQLVWHLLRLRKKGLLPVLKRRNRAEQ